ncbi:MAG: hypothetical protein H7Y43_00280 [Akkermansiaceae bacterium]|nr:hypothetical protein [Verrucomicrobiales bacterium]
MNCNLKKSGRNSTYSVRRETVTIFRAKGKVSNQRLTEIKTELVDGIDTAERVELLFLNVLLSRCLEPGHCKTAAPHEQIRMRL